MDSLERKEVKNIVESLIFVSEKPISAERIAQILGGDKRDVLPVIEELKEDYKERGIQIVKVSGGYQFRTRAKYSKWILRLNRNKPIRFSKPAIETLAIIAYKQPITRKEIEGIRGVDVGNVLRSLMKMKLVKIMGRKEIPGRPFTYGVTREFLELFGLDSIKDLPDIEEFNEV